MTVRRQLQRHLLLVGGLVVAVGLIAASDSLHQRIEAVILWSEAAIADAPLRGMVLFVALSACSAMLAFFSSAVLAPIAIVAWGQAVTFGLLWLGWLLGGVVSYCIGRFLGRRVAAVLVGEERINGWQQRVSERSRFVHILAIQAVVPSEIPGYVLGILHYRFLKYFAALAITELPYAAAVVYMGESFLERDAVVFVVVGGAMLLLAAFAVQIVRTLPRPGA